MPQLHRANARRDPRLASSPSLCKPPALGLIHSFSLPPDVLWLAVVSEFTYISLLGMGLLLMCVEAICLCAKRKMNALKINAYAAMCTVLSGEEGETIC